MKAASIPLRLAAPRCTVPSTASVITRASINTIRPIKSVPKNVIFQTLRGFVSESGSKTKEAQTLSIDVSKLLKTTGTEVSVGKSKPAPTPLEKEMIETIQTRGPLSTAQFMRLILTHPQHGYYMNKDVFGAQGDFTTSPEISQMFGELIGIWAITVWEQMGKPSKFNLAEVGPGRGTLMMDLLRTAKQFKPFYEAMSVHLVEVSPALSDIQAKSLTADKAKVQWHKRLEEVPQAPSIIIAQELFDALPTHQFEYTNRGWRERLIDVDASNSKHHFRYVLTPGPTLACQVLLKEIPSAHVGDSIEVSPDAQALAESIAKFVGTNGGGALVIDYGEERALANSLRTIRSHSFKHLFDAVGTSDVSVSVDFAALKAVVSKISSARSYGVVTQSAFLKQMGIETRLDILAKNANQKQAEDLRAGYERLTDEKQMGSAYKALAIMNSKLGVPFGFAT
eukprot:TRINITY_DN1920_c0_g1_i1.p1 TRINITY_DN1920_c0_g1~~TRINITY_DN1920_c0_g1_i1.p1  ORF type:complete len:453 (-),score=96.65 TRINITY_DN1920_c0_g1_i1:42-1400(-)